MANSKSSEKRIQIAKRNRLQNLYYKSSVRTLTKLFLKNLEDYKNLQDPKIKETLKKNLSSVYSLIDKGTKRNVFPKKTAARKKAQLAAYLKSV
jgi:small subunit ribosomal protein S20